MSRKRQVQAVVYACTQLQSLMKRDAVQSTVTMFLKGKESYVTDHLQAIGKSNFMPPVLLADNMSEFEKEEHRYVQGRWQRA